MELAVSCCSIQTRKEPIFGFEYARRFCVHSLSLWGRSDPFFDRLRSNESKPFLQKFEIFVIGETGEKSLFNVASVSVHIFGYRFHYFLCLRNIRCGQSCHERHWPKSHTQNSSGWSQRFGVVNEFWYQSVEMVVMQIHQMNC